MKTRLLFQICFLLFLVGCGGGDTTVPTEIGNNSSSTVDTNSTVVPTTVPIPGGASVVGANFLKAWEAGDYAGMYAQLTTRSQALVDETRFTARYQEAMRVAHVDTIRVQLQAAQQEGNAGTLSAQVTWESPIVGDIIRNQLVNLTFQDNRWGVEWSEGLILPELAGGNRLIMDITVPARGNIYDRFDRPLAYQGNAIGLGVIPGQIVDESGMLNTLSIILNEPIADIQALYANALPDWFVPIGDVSVETMQNNLETLRPYFGNGLVSSERLARIYPEANIAPHLIGYTTNIPPDQMPDYWALGYEENEKVGRTGIEAWGERYLGGTRGGKLSVVDPNGQIVGIVQETQSKQARSVYTSFNKDFQQMVQDALASAILTYPQGNAGAAVVLDVNNGDVLAMATYPSYSNDIFDTTNPNYPSDLNFVLNSPGRPLVNRPLQGQYPPGSVFKIVTLSAGLLSGQYGFDSRYTSNGQWDGLGENFIKTDWKTGGHGNISYSQALVESCNTCFYDMAFRLNETDPFFFPTVARQFNLDNITDMEGVAPGTEAPGLIPDPEWKAAIGGGWVPGDAVNMGIGQGDVLVTPLQIATIMAAIANGGTFYQPTVVHRIGAGGGAPDEVLPPNPVGQLPISSEQLNGIRQALIQVTTADKGTATDVFRGMPLIVAGKTGTAENAQPIEHAWFASYAPAAPYTKPDGTVVTDPEIAVVVIIENAGEGSAVAAPIVRRIIEQFYLIQPLTPFPWEG